MNFGNTFSITNSVQNGIDKLTGLLPAIIGFILLIFVGWILAKVAKSLVRRLLRHMEFDRHIAESTAGRYVERVISQPTRFTAKLVYWIIFLSFILFAISSLGVPALTMVVNGVYAYIPDVIAAIIIFLVASAITAGAEAFVYKVMGQGALAKIMGAVVPAIIMPIAIFMVLDQLKIARNIVDITYTALVGSVALGLALAFGLGGRDVASRMLEQAYANANARSGQLSKEYKQTKKNTRAQARNTRRRLQ